MVETPVRRLAHSVANGSVSAARRGQALMRLLFAKPTPIAIAESFQMHLLTVAHISPIVSLIAGVLILIMPRFLNFIVAAFLILNGLLGLGLLKWLHL
jgi:Protein of unknown function (DUF3096)